jgi:hypothetical protein
MLNRCRPLSRALFLFFNDPGVPLRSTPGFMLSPRFAGSMQTLQPLDQSFLQFVAPRDKQKLVGHQADLT